MKIVTFNINPFEMKQYLTVLEDNAIIDKIACDLETLNQGMFALMERYHDLEKAYFYGPDTMIMKYKKDFEKAQIERYNRQQVIVELV